MEEEKKVKKKLSKKILIFLIIVIVLFIIILGMFFGIRFYKKIHYYGKEYYSEYKSYIDKGYELYGYDLCEGHSDGIDVILYAPTGKCSICEEYDVYGTELCGYCATKCNRCSECGKLLDN